MRVGVARAPERQQLAAELALREQAHVLALREQRHAQVLEEGAVAQRQRLQYL